MSVLLVPHLNKLPNGGVIMNVSSVLGYNPFSIVNPVYNGTKAWVHFFSMNLRTQLRDAGKLTSRISNHHSIRVCPFGLLTLEERANSQVCAFTESKIKVVEIVPPTVETSLHRERKDPDDNKRTHGNLATLTVTEFMEQVRDGWEKNKDICPAGLGHELVEKWYKAYGEAYTGAGG